MAKVKYSALVSDMRNKLNGSVLSKNRYGSYIRNKVTPVNPQTSFQQNARQVLGSLSQGWAGLTPAQRNGWNALAPNLPFTDIFGDSKTLSGASLYVKLNANLLKIEESAISAAPEIVAIPSIEPTVLAAVHTAGAITTLNMTIDPETIPAGFELAVYATPGVKPSVSFVKNQFRFIGIAPAPAAGVINLVTLFNARFGTVQTGQRIFVRIALVSTSSGQQGVPSQVQAAITAA